jgi:hypothetical protein
VAPLGAKRTKREGSQPPKQKDFFLVVGRRFFANFYVKLAKPRKIGAPLDAIRFVGFSGHRAAD